MVQCQTGLWLLFKLRQTSGKVAGVALDVIILTSKQDFSPDQESNQEQ